MRQAMGAAVDAYERAHPCCTQCGAADNRSQGTVPRRLLTCFGRVVVTLRRRRWTVRQGRQVAQAQQTEAAAQLAPTARPRRRELDQQVSDALWHGDLAATLVAIQALRLHRPLTRSLRWRTRSRLSTPQRGGWVTTRRCRRRAIRWAVA